MRRIGLTAAALLVLLSLTLAFIAGGSAQATVVHTCSATDRQFIQTASLNLASIGELGDEYIHGGANASDVIAEARNAATRVGSTDPSDPSLKQTRRLLNGMFAEYGKAVQAKAKHRDSGGHMYRSYGLANFAHTVLVQAQPALLAHGCDISPLL